MVTCFVKRHALANDVGEERPPARKLPVHIGERVHDELRGRGRAAAPPGMGCIIGVSTSVKSRSSKKLRTYLTILARVVKTLRDDSFMIKSRYR